MTVTPRRRAIPRTPSHSTASPGVETNGTAFRIGRSLSFSRGSMLPSATKAMYSPLSRSLARIRCRFSANASAFSRPRRSNSATNCSTASGMSRQSIVCVRLSLWNGSCTCIRMQRHISGGVSSVSGNSLTLRPAMYSYSRVGHFAKNDALRVRIFASGLWRMNLPFSLSGRARLKYSALHRSKYGAICRRQ